ncbi:hypothetical protein DITRI_Ditri17bG0087900 [Diplodiscus trichospermus]
MLAEELQGELYGKFSTSMVRLWVSLSSLMEGGGSREQHLHLGGCRMAPRICAIGRSKDGLNSGKMQGALEHEEVNHDGTDNYESSKPIITKKLGKGFNREKHLDTVGSLSSSWEVEEPMIKNDTLMRGCMAEKSINQNFQSELCELEMIGGVLVDLGTNNETVNENVVGSKEEQRQQMVKGTSLSWFLLSQLIVKAMGLVIFVSLIKL